MCCQISYSNTRSCYTFHGILKKRYISSWYHMGKLSMPSFTLSCWNKGMYAVLAQHYLFWSKERQYCSTKQWPSPHCTNYQEDPGIGGVWNPRFENCFHTLSIPICSALYNTSCMHIASTTLIRSKPVNRSFSPQQTRNGTTTGCRIQLKDGLKSLNVSNDIKVFYYISYS